MSTLLLSQYGRTFLYMQCRIDQWADPDTPLQCDCQKQLPFAPGEDPKDAPASRTSVPGFEEYDFPVTSWSLRNPIPLTVLHGDTYLFDYHFSLLSNIFHPPKA
jgi:hypothetical protein